MTTTPTAPPELPDLDRLEALARGLSDIRDQIMQGRVVSVVDVEDLIDRLALARRAQPEGEAPQADAARYRYIATLQDWSEVECLCRSSTASSAAQYKRDLDKLIDARRPAAQHAESGAPAAELATVPCPCVAANQTPVCDDCDGQGRLIVSKRDLADHLAAQSQGAQALTADDLWEIQGALRAHGKVALSRKVADAASRAQQAAAPGALDDDERAKWTTKQWYEHVGAWETAEGYIAFGSVMALGAMLIQFQRAHRPAAPSAPGTPEAPADIALDAQRWRALLGSARIRPLGGRRYREPAVRKLRPHGP